MQQVWVLQSLYKQDSDREPINRATAIFSTKELAEKKKQEIEDTRKDIKEVYTQCHFVCTGI